MNFQIKKLSLSARLIISNLAFAVPIFILVNLMYKSETVNIEFTRQELRGNEYQRPLMELLLQAGTHRVVAQRSLLGDSAAHARLPELQGNVDRAFALLNQVHAQVGTELQFTPEGLAKRKRDYYTPANMAKEWSDLKGRLPTLRPAESNELHAKLIAGLRTMITHSGDTSNLILDPDLDSYYLMDVSLLAVPQMEDRIQDIATQVEPLLRRGQLTADELIKVSVFASMLREADLERTKASAQTSLNEDPNFYGGIPSLSGNLTPALGQLSSAVSGLLALLTQIHTPGQPKVSPEAFSQAAERALAATASFWTVAATELDNLLRTRDGILSNGRAGKVITSLIALILASLLTAYIAFTFQQSMGGIRGWLKLLQKSADDTLKTSGELVEVSQKVSSASTEQAAAIQETVSTLNEITAMVNKSVDNAQRSTEASHASHKVAGDGKGAVTEMIRAIDDISQSNERVLEAVRGSGERIGEVIKVITEIANKTKIINDIVFQTKLLSFNASVEAARAGEHGKGFAVVAEEIGNLAQMSGSAAKEIAEMVSSSIERVQSIVTETQKRVEVMIDQGSGKLKSGITTAHRCGQILEEVVHNVEQVKHMMEEIAVASKEQAQAITAISTAMNQIDESTHLNANSAQETSSYAGRLSGYADQLRATLKDLESEVMGQAQAARAGGTGSGPAAPASGGSVISFPSRSSPPAPAAAAFAESVPSADDPRFAAR
jgi:methyl-accepting chemotaxis protein